MGNHWGPCSVPNKSSTRPLSSICHRNLTRNIHSRAGLGRGRHGLVCLSSSYFLTDTELEHLPGFEHNTSTPFPAELGCFSLAVKSNMMNLWQIISSHFVSLGICPTCHLVSFVSSSENLRKSWKSRQWEIQPLRAQRALPVSHFVGYRTTSPKI